MNLALDFGEPKPEKALTVAARNPLIRTDSSLERVVETFEAMHAEPGSPITAIRRQPAREPELVEMPATIDDRLKKVLAERGIEKLYSHQGAAFDIISQGDNVVVVTPTASGKTLCYNLPVLNALLADPQACALYLFPTKALSEDQLASFHETVEAMGSDIRAFTYDGDTPSDARRAVRRRANVVLTNPDMLHAGVLPHHTKWARFFENLKFIVVDELHTYRGVFGSHLREHLPPPRADLRVLRLEAPVHLLLGDHRQPARAGRGAGRATLRRDRAQRRPFGREILRLLQPAGGQPPARHPPQLYQRIPPHGPGLSGSQPANSGLRQQPAGDRSPGALPQGRLRELEGRRDDPRLPRRISASRAARDRAPVARRRNAWRRLDLGARAGRRHRVARRLRHGRLPRLGRLHLAARRPRRATAIDVGDGDGRLVRADRPVHRRAPRVFLRGAAGAGVHQSRQSRDPGQPPEVRHLRAAPS